jgi:hypothetical protein
MVAIWGYILIKVLQNGFKHTSYQDLRIGNYCMKSYTSTRTKKTSIHSGPRTLEYQNFWGGEGEREEKHELTGDVELMTGARDVVARHRHIPPCRAREATDLWFAQRR